MYLVLLFVSRGVLSSCLTLRTYTPLTTVLWTGRRRSLEFWEEKRDEIPRGGDISTPILLDVTMWSASVRRRDKRVHGAESHRRRPESNLHVSGNMRRNSQKISSSVANTLNTSKSGEEKEKEEEHLLETLLTVPPARAIIDGKVAALGKMQRSLASAVARVHARADNLVNGDYNREETSSRERS